jgi:hypothetical protein
MAVEKELSQAEANDRDKAALLKAARDAEGTGAPEPDDDSEPDAGDDDGASEPPADPDEVIVERRAPRRERRAARYPEVRAELETTRQQVAQLTEQIQRLQQPQPQFAPPPPPQQPDMEAQIEGELEALRQADQEIAGFAAGLGDRITAQQIAALQRQQEGVQARRHELLNMRFEARRQRQAPPPQSPMVTMLRDRYIDVVNNPIALKHAELKQIELRMAGRNGFDAMEEAYQYGRAAVNGGGNRAKPSDAQRARYTGSSGNGGQGSQRTPTEQKRLTEEEAAAADLTFKYIPDQKKRHLAYYDKVKAPNMRRGA